LANEIYATYDEGNTLYALIWRKADDLVWNDLSGAFETYTDADIDEYDIPLANQVDSDYYSADFPVAITGTDPEAYRVQVMLQPGAIDADADFGIFQGEIIWDGTQEIDLGVLFTSNQTTLNRYNEVSVIVIDETDVL
jgi:hypothetical protein